MPINWEQLALGPRQTIDTTYADLRPSDLVIDKSGQAWPIQIIAVNPPEIGRTASFWLKDPVTKVSLHLMTKDTHDAVKVSRLPTQADEASKLEAEFLEASAARSDVVVAEALAASTADSFPTMADAVAAVEEIGGTVEAEVTAAEVDAAAAATDDAPLTIIPFADMTPLEARSHLYLLHGVYGHDLQSKAELAALHDQAHAATAAGTLNSRHVPHVHQEA